MMQLTFTLFGILMKELILFFRRTNEENNNSLSTYLMMQLTFTLLGINPFFFRHINEEINNSFVHLFNNAINLYFVWDFNEGMNFFSRHINEEINNSFSAYLMMQLTFTLFGILMKELIFFSDILIKRSTILCPLI